MRIVTKCCLTRDWGRAIWPEVLSIGGYLVTIRYLVQQLGCSWFKRNRYGLRIQLVV